VVPETLNSELPPASLSASRGGVAILSIITFYIAASVLLWWTRENAMMHSVGLVVLGVIILWVSLLPTMHSTVQSPKKSPVQHRRRGDPQIVRSLPSTPSSPSTSSTSTQPPTPPMAFVVVYQFQAKLLTCTMVLIKVSFKRVLLF
jgi:apolipoprotein N-acyltransferase